MTIGLVSTIIGSSFICSPSVSTAGDVRPETVTLDAAETRIANFSIGIDEVVEWGTTLSRAQDDVPTRIERNPVAGMRSEELFLVSD